MKRRSPNMYCWKSINLNKQYGGNRIFLLSFLTTLLVFITLFTVMSLYLPIQAYRDDYVLLFMVTLLFLYPIHKMFHLIPMLLQFRNITFTFKLYNMKQNFPFKLKDPVSKRSFLFSLLTPFSVITISFLFGALFYPAYAHYFAILISVHLGICVPDFITLWNVLHSPQKCLFEMNEDGFEILINK